METSAARTDYLLTPIEYLKGVGPQRADILKKELDIHTFKDLLYYFPYRHVDRSVINRIRDINPDTAFIQLKGIITDYDIVGDKRQKRLTANFFDGTGNIELVWFRGVQWIEKTLKRDTEYIIFGRPAPFKRTYSIAHPELELADSQNIKAGKIIPLYNTTEKMKARSLDSSALDKIVLSLLQGLHPNMITENLSPAIMAQNKFMSRYDTLRIAHFPPDNTMLQAAIKRLKFEDFFFIQLSLLQKRVLRHTQAPGIALPNIQNLFTDFLNTRLPFQLTNAQKRVLKEIRSDILSGHQMNRLLQGDVGSGKTIVALLCMLMATDNGYQSAIMAPTEILAQQHYFSLAELLKDMPINIALLTSNVKGKERERILYDLSQGTVHIIIGTHAIIEDAVLFKNLAMVVIDEQHRFGVAQRAQLWKKHNPMPHVLVMTATPIPRTLSMTMYGDLDVSVIDELPPGRKPITTVHRYDTTRATVYAFVKEEIAKGRQIYIVFPLIEESEALDYQNLQDGFERVRQYFPYPDYTMDMLHGRMASDEKDKVMRSVVSGKTQVLISTTVIEVGVNVPNASVMIVESAERFGLSQLHQLRGRVGRGADQSYCILMTGPNLNDVAQTRIRTLCQTNDGFKISEVDLMLRGPGDIEGTQQSGSAKFKMADLLKDQNVLSEARLQAEHLLQRDPQLALPENLPIRQYIFFLARTRSSWSAIS